MQRHLSKNKLNDLAWPIHLKPQPDELLSSWLMRLTRAYGVKPHVFYHHIWPHKQILTRDIDRCFDQELLDSLAVHTATPFARTFDTTLEAFCGKVFLNWNINGNTRWIMPLGIYHRLRTRYGLQFCSACLAQDSKPYFRRHWRLAFITVCTTHHCRLFDACPSCNSPVMFHRTLNQISYCYHCQHPLSAFKPQPADTRVLQFQQRLEKAINQGWFVLEHEPIYSIAFLDGLHQLMRLISTGTKAAVLRSTLRNLNEQSPNSNNSEAILFQAQDVEKLRAIARYRVLQYVINWLDNWPQHFINVCRSAKTLSSVLLRDMTDAPYWYWHVVHEHLYRPRRRINDEEIASAVQYLIRHKLPLSENAVSMLFGYRGVFKGRSKTFADHINHKTTLDTSDSK